MVKELGSALIGAIIGGGISLYAAYLGVQSQQESLIIQIEASKEELALQLKNNNDQFVKQLNYQENKLKQNRLFDVTSKVLLDYGDVTYVLNRIRSNKEYWYKLNSHAQILSSIGEARASKAVMEFYHKGSPGNNEPDRRKAYYDQLEILNGIFSEELSKY